MNRRQLALISLPAMALAFALGFVIFDQSWGLAATILVSYGIIAFLSLVVIVVAMKVMPRSGPHSRPPAITRSH